MSFARPTLTELIARGQADVDARLPGADSRLRRSAIGALVTVQAGAVHGLYGHLDWLARQILADTADAEFLERHAAIFGVARKVATLATGPALATGVDGSVIPMGTTLQRAGGLEYVTQAEATIAEGEATLSLAAVAAGVAAVAPAGTVLTFVSPVAGVAGTATVSVGGLTGGAEAEDDELLRERLLARIRQAPEGGARHDYEIWTLQVPEVTRAWVYPGWMGAGTVGVSFMMDGRESPIPLEPDVAAVAAHLAALAPVTAEVVVFAPTPLEIDLEITGLTPDSGAVRAAVVAEIEDLLFRVAEPGGTVLISQVRAAISQAAGEFDHVLVSPIANVVSGPAELAVLGTIDWGD
jgi:uncharacterized phage protein gp47/JayE